MSEYKCPLCKKNFSTAPGDTWTITTSHGFAKFSTNIYRHVCYQCIRTLEKKIQSPDILDEITKAEVGLKRSNPNKKG